MDQALPARPDAAQIKSQLHELASALREARHLDPETQQTIADLLDELSEELDQTAAPSEHATHLADTAAQVAQALHQQDHHGILTGAKERLEEAAARAGAEAPVVTGIVQRFLDALASMGI